MNSGTYILIPEAAWKAATGVKRINFVIGKLILNV